MAFKPALLTDSEHLLFNSIKCMLHGLPDHQTEPTPICARSQSSSLKPVAIDEYLFNFFSCLIVDVANVLRHPLQDLTKLIGEEKNESE